MRDILYRSMLSKVRALLKIEASHSKEDRASQQWQLLFDIDNTQFMVGKGGVNTTFYKVGDTQRILCYPNELLEFLESLTRRKYATFAICNKGGRIVKSGLLSEKAALAKNAPVGFYIVAMENGRKVRLFVRKSGVFGDNLWQPYHTKAK